MPITTYEYIPGKVTYQKIYGTITTADLQQGGAELIALLDQATEPMHIISDGRQVGSYPMNVRELAKLLSLFRHPQMGWELLLSDSPVTRFIGSSVVQVTSKIGRAARFKAFSTPAELLQFLKHIDPALEDLPPLPETPV